MGSSKTIQTSPELKGQSIMYKLLRFCDFIFHPFGIIVAGGVGIRITKSLHVSANFDEMIFPLGLLVYK